MKQRIAVLMIGFFALGTLYAQQDEYKAKALFLYNFSRLIEWPGATGSDFIIGVYGDSPIVGELEKMVSGKMVGGKKIVVKVFNSSTPIYSCHILYVSSSANAQLAGILSKLGNGNTLVVGEVKGMVDSGAAINFVLNDNRLSFELDVENANRQGLRVSKTLENMAYKAS